MKCPPAICAVYVTAFLSCLQYEIQQDKKRLEEIKGQVEKEEIRYDNIHTVHKTFMEIEHMGKKTLTGKVTISSEDFNDLSNMAKQSVAARSKILSHCGVARREFFKIFSPILLGVW